MYLYHPSSYVSLCHPLMYLTSPNLLSHVHLVCLFPSLLTSVCASPVLTCVAGLHCCDRAEEAHCQASCKHILRTMTTEHEIMEGLIKECNSQPLPQVPLWQCFLGSAIPPPPDPEPHPQKIDWAKLHCCSKANTSLCRSVGASNFIA